MMKLLITHYSPYDIRINPFQSMNKRNILNKLAKIAIIRNDCFYDPHFLTKDKALPMTSTVHIHGIKRYDSFRHHDTRLRRGTSRNSALIIKMGMCQLSCPGSTLI